MPKFNRRVSAVSCPYFSKITVSLCLCNIAWGTACLILSSGTGRHKLLFDEAVNLTSEKHDPCAQTSHLYKRRKEEYLAEGTGVESDKYPPKVKLEIFSQL